MKDAETKVKLGKNWTECFEDAKKASESLPPGFKGVATIFRTCVYKFTDECRRLGKYFKKEWNQNDSKLGMFHKPWLVLKYAALGAMGVMSCIPGYSAAVGFATGIATGVISANRNSAGLIKTAVSAVYGGYIGLQVGWIPVIGPGLACGLIKGSIEGVQDAWNTAPDKKGWWPKFKSFVGHSLESVEIISKRIAAGALKGLMPVIGPALVSVKLDRQSAKTTRQQSGVVASTPATAVIPEPVIKEAKKLTPDVPAGTTSEHGKPAATARGKGVGA